MGLWDFVKKLKNNNGTKPGFVTPEVAIQKYGMVMSKKGIQKLMQWEGTVKVNGLHVPYDDATGKPVKVNANGDLGKVSGYLTIGVGHLLTRSELTSGKVRIGAQQVKWYSGLSEENAMLLFDQDLDMREKAVNDLVRVPLQQNQFEVLVSFVYNVGVEAFANSGLLRLLNQGQYKAVPDQLLRWNRSGGRVIQGLINRRNHEIDYWING